ncbi:MAG: carbohydrate kinase family protein [Chloroflexi bacterium]|nr:carbohydrate kinase family protein [Chloroflexota bacterium]
MTAPTDVPVLVTAGYLNIDFVAQVPALPETDGRATATRIDRLPGGMAANVACAAAALGPPWPVRAELIATVGNDLDSDWAIGEMRRRGVVSGGIVRRAGGHAPRCLILVEPGGERLIVSEALAFDATPLVARLSQLDPPGCPRLLHLDGYRVPAQVPATAAARAAGWRASVDLDGLGDAWRTPAGLLDVLGQFDVVFINRGLARAVWPAAGDDGALAAAIGQVQATTATPALVLLTLGAAGVCVLAPGAAPVWLPALAVAAVDTTGAGDVFAGVFLAASLHGAAPVVAARHAVAAAALSTTASGALGYLPTADAVLQATHL